MKLRAHVPTQQYGFIEIEGSPEEAAEIERLYNKYAETPVKFRSGNFVRLTDMFGNQIDYDGENHVYMWDGVQYQSASTIAKGEQTPFDSVLMSGKVAEKYGADPTQIAKLWELSGKVSRDFGTTVHLALELYGKYQNLAKSVEKEYHTPNHTALKSIVEGFYKGRENEKAMYEVLVVDHKAKRAGTIDRLQIVAPKTCIIEDYKIAYKEDIPYWSKQLEVYEGIMVANGWTVKGKVIHQYDGGWKDVAV